MKKLIFLILYLLVTLDLLANAGGNALAFNGVDEYLDLGNNFKFTDRITIELWAYRDSWNLTPGSLESETMISCMETGGWRIELQNYATGDSIEVQAYCGGTYQRASVSTDGLNPGWVYIKAKIYSNAYLTIRTSNKYFYKSIDGHISYDSDNYTIIGADASGGTVPQSRFWNGKIDDVKIWDDIFTTYNTNRYLRFIPINSDHPEISNLRGYYSFDELGTDNQYDDLTNQVSPNPETCDATPHNSPTEVTSTITMGDFPDNFQDYFYDYPNSQVIGADTNQPSPFWCCGMTVAMAVNPITPPDQFITIGTDNVAGNTLDDLPPGVDKRTARTWYVDQCFDTVKGYTFDLDYIDGNDLYVFGIDIQPEDYKLLYRPDTSSEFVIYSEGYSIGSHNDIRTSAEIPVDGYYTLGISYGSPTIQAKDIVFESIYSDSIRISWTGGNGDYSQMVFVKEGNSGQAIPDQFTIYNCNSTFGAGSQIGTTGWYSVYTETPDSCTITGLQPDTEYIISICEYSTNNGKPVYSIQTETDNPRNFWTKLSSPENINVQISGNYLILTWDTVTGAVEYNVYSSDDPYGSFMEDTGGVFNGESWSIAYSEARKFYYIVATGIAE